MALQVHITLEGGDWSMSSSINESAVDHAAMMEGLGPTPHEFEIGTPVPAFDSLRVGQRAIFTVEQYEYRAEVELTSVEPTTIRFRETGCPFHATPEA
jgi:hypothetical protein